MDTIDVDEAMTAFENQIKSLTGEEKESPWGKSALWLFNSAGAIGRAVRDIHLTWVHEDNTTKKMKDVSKLINELSKLAADKATEASNVKKSMCDVFTNWVGRNECPVKNVLDVDLTNIEDLKHQLETAIKEVQKEEAKGLMRTMVTFNTIILVTQIIREVHLWEEIKKAGNLIKDPARHQAIDANITTLQKDLAHLGKENLPVWQRTCLVSRINRTILKTTQKIGDLRANIDGQVRKLMTLRDQKPLDAIANASMAASQFATTFNLADSLSGPWKIVGYGLSGLCGLMAVSNVRSYYLTDKRIRELEEELALLMTFSHTVESIQESIEHLMEDFLIPNEEPQEF
eukprot:TRINITY_DN1283_c0_g1::TRINITY_DN1283_c0_g1_i1::g.26837::m.26837 TRINITY_DN1283_c0_g1::TRINITY_DN1283_c0_g1_i1::g.26837  ORF type:complete len:345 (+),score=45.85,Pox_vIL-18BP/PF05566.7/0.065,Pox_A_type_inc/PF04508.7/4.6e+03,Pox_A_type_inc/PF04508.7/7.8,Pox_A_type_inc/PF04508.7/3.8e+03,Pox_A_type_inc/PF04508.7/62,Syntaxin_2/PF14523.1/6.6e+03,Syntaxin_2/PF14523.1/57,Syntaxin_2/PF14523.1/1.3,Syntaxin_2/PF14523.1/5e+03,Fib_alpha/PF08702.5/1.3e+02,Fib_alpha/PF08702.5/4.3e+02,Fib_alpha/PF08702.5/19,Fi